MKLDGLTKHVEALLLHERALVPPTLDAPLPPIIVAVSGGPDSTCLLRSLVELRSSLNLSLSAAHVAYGLRGDESEADRTFVEEMCTRWELPLEVRVVSDRERTDLQRTNLQEAARDLRRVFLFRKAQQLGGALVAMGHNLEDQVETFFLHLLRGCGLPGLRGMETLSSEGIYRPLLSIPRKRILAFLGSRRIVYRRDRSNDRLQYARNRVRHELLPQLRRLQPACMGVVHRTMGILAREDECLKELAKSLVKREGREEPGGGFSLDGAALGCAHEAIALRTIRSVIGQVAGAQVVLSSGASDEILSLLRRGKEGARAQLRKLVSITLSRGRLYFYPPSGPRTYHVEVPLRSCTIHAGSYSFRVTRHERGITRVEPGFSSVVLPLKDIAFPLVLRCPRRGERFRPKGFGDHRKSLSQFFQECRIPLPLRTTWPVLEDERGILWIAGLRHSSLAGEFLENEAVLEMRLLPSGSGLSSRYRRGEAT